MQLMIMSGEMESAIHIYIWSLHTRCIPHRDKYVIEDRILSLLIEEIQDMMI